MSIHRGVVDRLLFDYRASKKAREVEKEELETARTDASAAEEAQTVLQTVAASVQAQAHQKIAAVVSHCLQTVFDEPYQFKIHFDRKRGRTEARLVFIREGVEFDPLTSTGGGAVDVAAFALRCACLMLSKPARRRFLLLDEPFRFVSAEYGERVALMLVELSKELGIQFVMVTHKDELVQGTVIRL